MAPALESVWERLGASGAPEDSGVHWRMGATTPLPQPSGAPEDFYGLLMQAHNSLLTLWWFMAKTYTLTPGVFM